METNPLATLFGAFTAYQRTAALRAAIELDVFGAILAGDDSPAALARHRGASERGLRILCDSLVVLGFLEKKAGGGYGVRAEFAPFLDAASPVYVGSAIRFLTSPTVTGAFDSLTEAVRRGATVLPEQGSLEPEHPVWVEFARSMAPLAAMGATLLANLLEAERGEPWKVLDVAAGHGLFGITVARQNPRADVVLQDWPNVLAVAEENARRHGVADRVRLLPGSFFDVDLGTGYDVVLLANFLHHLDREGCETALRRVHAALRPGGRAVALEMVPNEDRVSPPEPAFFALVMLATTPKGDAYTFADYEPMFRRAGFARAGLRDLPPSFQRAIVAER